MPAEAAAPGMTRAASSSRPALVSESRSVFSPKIGDSVFKDLPVYQPNTFHSRIVEKTPCSLSVGGEAKTASGDV